MGGKGRGKKGGGHWFHEGKAAWQVLSRDTYNFLKRSHEFRLDKWSRVRNIS
jgi:hypothetical protein